MHRLTLPHAFRTSCNNEIKRPFCTPRRGTLLTQRYVRAVEGEKERERAEWRSETERRDRGRDRDARATQRNDKTRARRGSTKIQQERGRDLTHTVAEGSSTKHNAWDKQKCVQQRGSPKSLCLFFLTLRFSFARIIFEHVTFKRNFKITFNASVQLLSKVKLSKYVYIQFSFFREGRRSTIVY